MIAGNATWSWKCPDCGGAVIARRAVNDELDGTLLEFAHDEPICPAFDEGDNLEAVVKAWKDGKFSGDGPSSGVS